MAEVAKIDLELNGSGAATTLGELKDNVEKLNTALEQAQIGSAEYKKLNQELITTNKSVKNLELGFEALDSENVASEIGSVAGAIGDVATGLVLVSGGNKSLEEMAANIEMALGVSMALKGGIEGLQSARKLWNDAMARGNKLQKIAIGLQNALNKASKANLFLVFASAIAAVAAAIMVWGRNASVTEATQEKLNEASLAGAEAAGKEEAKIKSLTTALLGAAKGTEARVNALEALNEVIPDSIGFITEETIATGEAITVIQEYIKVVKQRAELTALENLLAEQIGERVKLQAQLQGEGNAMTEQAIALSKEAENQLLQQIDALNKNISTVEGTNTQMVKGQAVRKESTRLVKENTEAVVENTDARDEAEAAAELAAQKEADRLLRIAEQEEALAIRKQNAQDQIDQINRDKGANEFELRLNRLTEEHEAEMSLLAEFIPEENELRLELQALYEEQVLDLETEASDAKVALAEQEEAEKAAIRQQAIDGTIAGATSLIASIESINNTAHKNDIARIKQKQANGEKLTASETKRLKKQEAIEKAFALTKIAIDTATAVAGAISSGANQPYPLNLVAIVTGVAAVLAGVASAYKALGGGSAPAGVNAPSIEQASENTENQANGAPVLDEFETGSSLLNAPQQVVVVEDINNGQNSVAAIEASATFG